MRLKVYYVTICLQWDSNLYATTSTTLASPQSSRRIVHCQRTRYPYTVKANTRIPSSCSRRTTSDHSDPQSIMQLCGGSKTTQRKLVLLYVDANSLRGFNSSQYAIASEILTGFQGRRRKRKDLIAKCLHARVRNLHVQITRLGVNDHTTDTSQQSTSPQSSRTTSMVRNHAHTTSLSPPANPAPLQTSS